MREKHSGGSSFSETCFFVKRKKQEAAFFSSTQIVLGVGPTFLSHLFLKNSKGYIRMGFFHLM